MYVFLFLSAKENRNKGKEGERKGWEGRGGDGRRKGGRKEGKKKKEGKEGRKEPELIAYLCKLAIHINLGNVN